MKINKKSILLLGATGRLGDVVLNALLNKSYHVTVLVRSPKKLKINNDKLRVTKGDVASEGDLREALEGVRTVVAVLGHGFRTPYPVQSRTLEVLVPLMVEKNIKRIITITGAALKTKEDPRSRILDITEKLLSLIDPYRIKDAKRQQELLEKSNLDWTVVRTPVHKDGSSTLGAAGYKQPTPWQRVTRSAVANFILECIEKNKWVRKSPIFC